MVISYGRKFSQECLTLLHTPVELREDVVQQNITERLKVLCEDVTDGIKCVVAGCGHPFSFLHTNTHVSVTLLILKSLS